MTSADFFFAVASRRFRRVYNSDGWAASLYNPLIVHINIFSTYDVTLILHRVPLVSQRRVQWPRNFFSRYILMLSPGWYLVKWALVNINIFLYVFKSSLPISCILTFLRVSNSHSPSVPLNTVPLTVQLASGRNHQSSIAPHPYGYRIVCRENVSGPNYCFFFLRDLIISLY